MMSDDPNKQEETPEEQGHAPAPGEQEPQQEAPKGDPGEGAEDVDSLPKWARDSLTKANSEAAAYRTKLRETEEKLKGAKSPEEFDAARTELTAQIEELNHQLLVTEVARKTGLPDELIPRLQGKTEEELTNDAKSLVSLLAPRKQAYQGDVRGGLDPSSKPDGIPSDPRETAALLKKHRGWY